MQDRLGFPYIGPKKKSKGRTYKSIDGGYIDRTVLKSQSKGHIVGSTAWDTSQNIAPCKGIWISESGKFSLVNSGIQGFGIRNTAFGIRNPTNDWNQNPRSTHKGRNPVPGIRNRRCGSSTSQECLRFPSTGGKMSRIQNVQVKSQRKTWGFQVKTNI